MDTDTESPKIHKVQRHRKFKKYSWLVGCTPRPKPQVPEVPTQKPETDPSRFSSTLRFIEDRQRTFYGRPPLDILSRFLALFSLRPYSYCLQHTTAAPLDPVPNMLIQQKSLLEEGTQHRTGDSSSVGSNTDPVKATAAPLDPILTLTCSSNSPDICLPRFCLIRDSRWRCDRLHHRDVTRIR